MMDAASHPLTVDPGALLLSPRTRRRQRGRGVVVLDNVTTATSMTNATVLTPELLSSMNPLLADAVVANLNRQGAQLQGPSPDELIIQARGRRRIPLTFSPDVHSLTPTVRQQRHKISSLAHGSCGLGSQGCLGGGGMTRLLLPTRTSPRKRLTLNDSPPHPGGGDFLEMPSSVFQTPSPDKSKRSPISKKIRVEEESQSPPCVLMKGLTRAQLIDVFTQLIGRHPEMEAEVLEIIPTPDLAPIEERLSYLKRNIFRALPNTRLESKTDSMSYNRVATHLVALKKAIVDEGRQLLEANQWAACVDFTFMAWNVVKATPVWDNPPHNSVRKQCFRAVAQNCMHALKKGTWEEDLAREIKNRLAALEKDSEELQPCIKHLEALTGAAE